VAKPEIKKLFGRQGVEGAAIARRFCLATALANDSAGNVYVVDQGRWQIFKVTPDGAVFKIGSGFRDPVGITFDPNDSAYVIEVGNSGVKKFSPSNVGQTTTDLKSSCFANPLTVPD
jgi:streptogramin lyase